MKVHTSIAGLIFIGILLIQTTVSSGEGNVLSFELDKPLENLKNFKRISDDLRIFENDYISCIKDIKDEEYTQDRIDECIGKNFVKILLDVKYETMKIMSKGETKLRDYFIKNCYVQAGVNVAFSNACDVLEKDILDFMWNGLNFVKLVDINREKYVYEYGEMPRPLLSQMLIFLKRFADEFFVLLNEVDSHKERAIMRIKEVIEERVQVIMQASQDLADPDAPQPHIIQHSIKIEEEMDPEEVTGEVADEEGVIDEPARKLPEMQIQTGSPDEFILPKRKLVKASSINNPKDKDSGVRIFNNHGKYSGLNSPNYTYKGRSLGSKHSAHKVISGLGSFVDPTSLRSKNVHTSYMQHRNVLSRFSK